MHRFIGLLYLLLTIGSLRAQMEINWETLANVDYSYIQNFEANIWYGKPEFSEEITKLEGQEVIIRGYILPMDLEGDQFVLSAYPFSACFYCGGAGQESVIELRLRKKRAKYQVDEVRTFIGTLRLNDAELELNYILDDARPYK